MHMHELWTSWLFSHIERGPGQGIYTQLYIFSHVHVHMHATHTHTRVSDSVDVHLITPSVGDILASEDSSAASEISSVPG